MFISDLFQPEGKSDSRKMYIGFYPQSNHQLLRETDLNSVSTSLPLKLNVSCLQNSPILQTMKSNLNTQYI